MNVEKLNFSVGPVMMQDEICSIGSQQVPYFRTGEFSNLMKENEILLKKLAQAEEESRVIFITGSGTAGMEAAVMNLFDQNDKVLVINGGSFGKRFQYICEVHSIPNESICLEPGEELTQIKLAECAGKGFTGLLINMHETSTGVLYNMPMISSFCKENNIFLVVDAISSFLADSILMTDWKIDAMILASQKALALPPGMSFLMLNAAAVKRVKGSKVSSFYFNLKDYLKDGERGQTPYTPAVGILLQLNKRLKILNEIGLDSEIERVHNLAVYFRKEISSLPFEMLPVSPSNALTALVPRLNVSAYFFFEELNKKYGIWVCPNGGELKDKVFRVGHIGHLERVDYDRLIEALSEIVRNCS